MASSRRRIEMASKKHWPEEAVAKLRQVDVLVSQGLSVAEAIRAIGVTGVILTRLNLDLFQVGIAGEAANALGGERIPGAAEDIDDGIVGVEQAVAQVPLPQEQPEPLDRVEVRRIRRQPDERDIARDHEPLGLVPASAVEHQDAMFALGQRRRELAEEGVHRPGPDRRRDEGEAVAGRRPDGAEEVGPSVTLVAQTRRPLATGEPAMADAPLLAETGLVHEPERQAFVAVRRPRVVQSGLQPPFANASRAAASAFGSEGRAFCRDRPSRRISLPMCEGWYDTPQRFSTSWHSSGKVQALRPVASTFGPSSTSWRCAARLSSSSRDRRLEQPRLYRREK